VSQVLCTRVYAFVYKHGLGANVSCTTTPNSRHVLTYLRQSPLLPLTSRVYKLASLANKPNREWLINSSAYPRTAPYSLNLKSSTVYPFSNQQNSSSRMCYSLYMHAPWLIYLRRQAAPSTPRAASAASAHYHVI
jgi:hypothetical protein